MTADIENKIAALIDSNNIVQNTIIWQDGDIAPNGLTAVVVDSTVFVSIGFIYNPNNNTFTDPNPPVPMAIPDISRRQFYQQAAIAKFITQDEAIGVISTGSMPSELQNIIDNLPAEERFNAQMLLLGAQTFQYNNKLTATIGAAFNQTEEQMQTFFNLASLL
jgi:hypothetical protein